MDIEIKNSRNTDGKPTIFHVDNMKGWTKVKFVEQYKKLKVGFDLDFAWNEIEKGLKQLEKEAARAQGKIQEIQQNKMDKANIETKNVFSDSKEASEKAIKVVNEVEEGFKKLLKESKDGSITKDRKKGAKS